MKKIHLALFFLAIWMQPSQACMQLQESIQRIVCLSDSLKTLLNPTQLSQLQLNFSYENSKVWSNLPTTFQKRLGISLGALNTTQLALAKSIVKEISGSQPKEGYEEFEQLLAADEYLKQNGGGNSYGAGLYYLCFNGSPHIKNPFSIKLAGHHLHIENTFNQGVLIGGTPHFEAIEPLQFSFNNTVIQPLIEEKNAFSKILGSLNTNDLAAAKLSTSFSDILLGATNNGTSKDWGFPATKSGLKVGFLSATQKEYVLEAIKTYVWDISDENSGLVLSLYTKELDDTYIAYSGTTSLSNSKDYVRIDGPSVWIEFSVQNGIVMQGVHYHSIWRDRYRDYGGQGSAAGIQSTAFGKSDVTSVKNQNSGISIDLTSNPSTQTIHLALTGKNLRVSKIYLSDVKGKIIRNFFNQQKTADQNHYTFSLENLPRGIYFLNLKIGTQKKILKVVKNP